MFHILKLGISPTQHYMNDKSVLQQLLVRAVIM